MQVPELRSANLLLRPFADGDEIAVLRAVEDPYVRDLTAVERGDEAGARAYVRRQRLRADRGLGASWAVVEDSTRACVGQIGLWLRAAAPDGRTGYVEEAHGRAALGYWVVPDSRGRGVATSALQAVSDWALGRGDLARLELFIEPSNEGSWRAAERAGFEREGLLRSWQKIGETRRDMYVYSRIA